MAEKPLKREINLLGLLFICIGSMIGSGWLFGSLYAAKAAGPASVLAWIIGAFAVLVIAFVYAELGATLPWPGGLARYPRLSFGYFSGLSFSWIAWLSYITVAPIEAQAVMEYAADYYPALTHTVNGSIELTHLGMTIAALLLFSFCLINYFGVKLFVRINNVIAYWKLFIPIATILIFMSVKFDVQNFTAGSGFFPLGWKGVLTAISTSGVIMAYTGFRAAIELSGETKNPQRALPFAIIGSVLICMFIYLGLQVAFIGSLEMSDIQNGWKNISFKGISGPFASLAMVLGLGWFAKVLFFDALVSPSGTALVCTGATARLTYAMGQKQFFPSWFTKLNKYQVPALGLFINYAVGLILLLPFPGWAELVGFISAAGALSFCSGPCVLLALRSQQPNLKRPFKVPFSILFTSAAFIISNLIVYWTGWETNSKLFLIIIGGMFLLLTYNLVVHGSKLKLNLLSGLWVILLIAGQTLLSYCGSFGGGKGWMPFGWDLLIVSAFSLCVLYTAFSFRLKNKEMEAINIS